jgi:GT2 family glycosyltransferase
VSAEAPFASVVIPAWHSADRIAACLDGLRDQRFRDFEAIVVNSSPGDGTAGVVGRYPEVALIESPERLLPHAARNAGAERATGQLIVFTDPDCVPAGDWLERLVDAHREGSQVVAGAMGLRRHSRREAGVHLCKFSWALPGLPPGTHGVAPTANAAYSRAVWERVGPFDGDVFCADALLTWRAAADGAPARFVPHARVDHSHDSGARGLLAERHGRGREFAAARMRFEGWSRGRAALHAVAWPALAGVCLARSARDAARAGWLGEYARSLPLQAVGQAGWCFGEARSQARRALGGPNGARA